MKKPMKKVLSLVLSVFLLIPNFNLATRVCENNLEEIETETVKVTAEEIEPTTTEDGKIIYIAVFENLAFEKQVKY